MREDDVWREEMSDLRMERAPDVFVREREMRSKKKKILGWI